MGVSSIRGGSVFVNDNNIYLTSFLSCPISLTLGELFEALLVLYDAVGGVTHLRGIDFLMMSTTATIFRNVDKHPRITCTASLYHLELIHILLSPSCSA